MKLFSAILLVYFVAVTLFGVDGRVGGGARGLQGSLVHALRVKRQAPIDFNELNGFPNADPPPPPQFRSRRNAVKLSENVGCETERPSMESKAFRQRRQMPAPPTPPEGFPTPPY